MKKKQYLAYGANLNISEMAYRCPNAEPIRRVELRGWQLEFCRHATIRQRPNARLQAALWSITEDCEARLDRFEGFPKYYRKQIITVLGQPTMVYLINDDRLETPSPGYYDTLRQGYKDWHLDSWYLVEALARAEAEDKARLEEMYWGA